MKMVLEMKLHNAESISSAAKRKRKKWNRKSNALCNSNDYSHDCLEGVSLVKDVPLQENSCPKSIIDKSGLIEGQSNFDLVCSESKKRRSRKQKQKRHNALATDNTESTADISSNSGLIEGQNNSSLMCSKNKKKRKLLQLKKKHDARKTNIDRLQEVTSKMSADTTESKVDISSNSGLIKAHINSSLMCLKNKKRVCSIHEAPATPGVRGWSILRGLSLFCFKRLCTKNKKKRKLLQLNKKRDACKTYNTDSDLHEVISKTTTAPFKTVALVDAVTKAALPLEVEALGDTRAKIEMNASVDTSSTIHSAQNLSRSQRKRLRRKLRKQGLHILRHDCKDLVLTGDKSVIKNMLPDEDSFLQLSVDLSKNELVVKQPCGDVCLLNGRNASETDRIANLQMEKDMNLRKGDMEKMDLAAAPIDIKASVDTSALIHSAENLSQSQSKKLRKKLRKQGVYVLGCDASKGCSPSKNSFPVKHSSFQPSVDICSKSQLVVRQSHEDVCLFNGQNYPENNRVIDLRMADGKHLENKEAQPLPKVAELDLTTMREDFPISEKQSSSLDTANRSLMEKDDVHAKGYPTLSETGNIVMSKRKKIFETNINKKREKCSDSLVNGLDCFKEDGDSSAKNASVLPEVQVEQKGRDKRDKISITVQDDSHEDGVSDEIPFHPKDNNVSGHSNSCKLPKEQHVEVETKRAETFPPTYLDVKISHVLHVAREEENHSQTVQSPPKIMFIGYSKKKLLVLDVNGLLADVVQSPCRRYKPCKMISKKAVFKRPYCDEFLQFCFERFNVGVWSSRIKKNLDRMIDFLMGDSRKNLLFCWHASHCTETGLNTIENKWKPLVLKELKKLWEKFEPNLPWEEGEYSETNTLLLDDSPYKALCNPAHTAIFPYPYDYRNAKDSSLGPGGDLRLYLEGLAIAENVQEYVRQNPFGQRAITERHSSWGFYSKVFLSKPRPPPYDDGGRKVTDGKSCEPSEDGNTCLPCQQL